MICKRRNWMPVMGVDAGAEYLKLVLLGDHTILSHTVAPYLEGSILSAIEHGLNETLNKACVRESDVKYIVATGVERQAVCRAHKHIPEAFCCARGAAYFFPSAKTVLDIGADKILAVRFEGSNVLKTAVNDRCAAGTGRFLRMVSSVLDVGIQELGQLSLQSKKAVDIENTCTVFAESEIISLIHQKHLPKDIIKGAFVGLARRIYPLLATVGLEKDIALVGGLAKNIAIVKALEDEIGFSTLVPGEPIIAGALGAAIIGASIKPVSQQDTT
jgi:predicted CoA-substrate-specific enzyme activase